MYCTSLSTVNIPGSVTSIERLAFNHCESLPSIDIPASVTSIGYSVFDACTSLASINVATDNTAYSSQDGILFNKSKTELWRYPESKSGNSYGIPNSVTDIKEYAFYGSTLTSIDIPGSVTSIEHDVFTSCKNLTAINVATDNTAYISENGILFNKSKNTLIKYPSAKPATAYSIPASVYSIKSAAVSYCLNLTTISLPATVDNIGRSAFSGCTNLRKIISYRPHCPMARF